MNHSTTQLRSTMTYEDFTRRVWQSRHALHVSNRNAKVTGIAVNFVDWIALVTDLAIGTATCRLHAESIGGGVTQWYWEDIPLHTDSTLPVNTISIRSETQA